MISIGRSLSFPASGARFPNPFDDNNDNRKTKRLRTIRPLPIQMENAIAKVASSSSASSSSAAKSSALILTSGATGRLSSLLSIRVLTSLLSLVHAFVFLILAPFYPRRYVSAMSSVSSSSSTGSVEKKGREDKQETAVVVRVPGGMVQRRVAGERETLARRAMAIRRVGMDQDEEGLDEKVRASSARDFSLFVTARGDMLFTLSWSPVTAPPKGLVLLLHGLNEHSSRYNRFAKQLNAEGFKVYGMDWIGHGGSDGLHGYVPSLDYAVDDMKAFLEKILAENPGLPCFCFGHSTGGSIVLKAVMDPKTEALVEGVVVTSPAVGVQPVHPLLVVVAPILSLLVPTYQLSDEDKKGMPVCRDPNALVAKYSDPLVFTGSIRVRTGSEILRISSHLQQNLSRIKVPFLVLHGTADTVTDPEASRKLHQEASSTAKSIKLYDGYLHDLLFEPERDDISKDIIDWLNSRLLSNTKRMQDSTLLGGMTSM